MIIRASTIALNLILYICLVAGMQVEIQGQQYSGEYKELKKGDVIIDRFELVRWPVQIPSQARVYEKPQYDYTFKKSERDPAVQLDGNRQNMDRAYVAVYYSPTHKDLKDYQLYRWGMGLNQMKFPMEQAGYYYIVAIAKGYSFIQLYQDMGDEVKVYKRVDRGMKVG